MTCASFFTLPFYSPVNERLVAKAKELKGKKNDEIMVDVRVSEEKIVSVAGKCLE